MLFVERGAECSIVSPSTERIGLSGVMTLLLSGHRGITLQSKLRPIIARPSVYWAAGCWWWRPSSEWSMQAPKSPKCYNYHAQYYLWSISITVCCLAVLLIYYGGVQCPKLRSLWSTLATFAGRGTGIHIWEEFLPPPRQQREKSLLTQGNYREYECCVDTEWAHTFTWQ